MVDWRHVNAVPRLNCNASIHSHHQPTFVYPRSIWFDSSLLDRWYHYCWYYAMFLKNIFVIFIIHRPQYYSQALHLPRPIPITQIHSYWSTPYWAQHIHRMSTELHAFCLNWSRVLFRISDGMWSIATLSVRIRGTITLIQPDHLSLWFSLDSWVLIIFSFLQGLSIYYPVRILGTDLQSTVTRTRSKFTLGKVEPYKHLYILEPFNH